MVMSDFDLETFFCSNTSNVKFFELKGCSIVVDGADFIRFIYLGIDSDGDDEYLKFSLKASAILNRFQQCNINPIFVFEGIISDTAVQYKISDTSTQECSMTVPILAQDTLLSVLKYYAGQQVVVNMPVFRAVSSLAACLHCPLLGSKNAYFLMGESSGSALPVFLPLALFLRESVSADHYSASHESNSTADGLEAHAFCPSKTVLDQLDPAYWPVLGVLWNSGLVSNRNQLLHPDGCGPEFSSSHDVSARLNGLINWIRHPSDDKLNQLASVLFEGNRTSLAEACAMFVCMPRTVGNLVKSIVQVPKPTDSPGLDDPNSSSFLTDLDTLISPEHTLPEGHILSGWPPKLTQAYRQGEIPLSVLASIYLPVGAIQRTRLECMDSILCAPARSITILIARLLLGMEQLVGNGHKLTGMDSNQVIWFVNSQRGQPTRLRIDPYHLNFRKDNSDSVLCLLFKLPQPTAIVEPDWLFGLAFTLGFWYNRAVGRRASDHGWFSVPLKQNSMALVMTVIAVATIYNVDYSYTELLPHYERVTQFVQAELTESLERRAGAVPSPGPSHPEPNREFSTIISIYRSLRSLVVLLDGMVRPDACSKLFCFLPPWIVFPSRILVHHLVNLLDLQLSTIRLEHVSYFWLPKLLLAGGKPNALEGAREVFNRVLDLASVILFQPDSTDTMTLEDQSQYDSSSESWTRGKVIEGNKDRASSEWTRGNIKSVEEYRQRSALREVSNFTPIRF